MDRPPPAAPAAPAAPSSGDSSYTKMSERRTSSGGGTMYMSQPHPPTSHSFAGGKMPMANYQAG